MGYSRLSPAASRRGSSGSASSGSGSDSPSPPKKIVKKEPTTNANPMGLLRCELCKQRKVKCDRGQPSCGWCSRNGAVCEYKERKKPGLRAGYGRELESRLDKLEAVLRRHSEVLQLPFDPAAPASNSGLVATLAAVLQRSSASAVSPSHHGPQQQNGSGASVAASEDRETNSSLFSRVGGAQASQSGDGALMFHKPSSVVFSGSPGGDSNSGTATAGITEMAISPAAMSKSNYNTSNSPTTSNPNGANNPFAARTASSISAIPSQPSPLSTAAAREYYGASAPPQGNGSALSSPSLALGPDGKPASHMMMDGHDQDLPPYDLTYALVDLYFKHINTWCPLLQRSPTIEALFGPSMADEANKIILHAIVATTLRFSTDARLTEERRAHYHDISKQRVLLYGMENSSVKALQAMVILALDFCGSSNGPPGWNIMALITRAVVQLGLAVETTSFSVSPSFTSIYTLRAMILPEPRDFVEEESRRRLFWVIYLLDRYATIATAFEFALDDREIDRTLPCRDDLWAKNQKVETRRFRPETFAVTISGNSPGSLEANSGFDGEAESGNGDGSGGGGGGGGGRNGDGSGGSGVAGGGGANVGGAVGVVANGGGGGSGGGGGRGRTDTMGAFSYYIEILGILTKIHNFLKLPVDISSLSDVEQWQMRYRELDNTLTAWKVGLPGEYGNMAKVFQPNSARVVNCGWVMLHVTYHTATIRLHSSSAYPTTRSPIFTPSYLASQRCHSAVEHIATLTEFAVSHNLLPKLGPPFAFSLWVAARLLLVHGSTVEHKLSPRLPLFVDALRAMGHYWPVAVRYCVLLQRVLDEHADSERHGDGVTPSSVKILADMRRTAFDLDLLISRQPRHISGGGGLGMGGFLGMGGMGNMGGGLGSMGAHGGGGGGGGGIFGGGGGGMGGSLHGGGSNGQGQGGGQMQNQFPHDANGSNGVMLHNNGGVQHNVGRFPSVTPARTPQPNDLEYLDVFDFFNVPRLPFGLPTEMSGAGGAANGNIAAVHGDPDGGGGNGSTSAAVAAAAAAAAAVNPGGGPGGAGDGGAAAVAGHAGGSTGNGVVFTNEFNITDFMIDANRDWLFKQENNSKFLS